MSNARGHRRRHRHGGPKLRNIAWINPNEVAGRLDACDCPAVIHTTASAVVVEHFHRHGCPALKARAS